MRVELKPGRSRIFNGVKIINPDRRHSVQLILEPANRLTESPVEERRAVDVKQESEVE